MERYFQLFTFLCILASISFYSYIYKELKLVDYCECDSKPLIYGEEFCTNIFDGKVVVSQSYFQNFINIFSSKSLFRGKFNNISVILKTTTSNLNLINLENKFFNLFKTVLNDLDNNVLLIKSEIWATINVPLGSSVAPKLRFCPYNDHVEKLFNRIPGYTDFTIENYLALWTILECNPEPFILKILDPKIWPVPYFFGSCGRLIVVEDCGYTLLNHYDDTWNVRAKIVYHLLENAFKLTFQDPEFAFYLTDLSPDNIAVTQDGIVKYIDLEHTIVVNKNSAALSGRLYNHTSKHHDCPNCLIFEGDEICSHRISDHNIYAVCKEILSDSELLPGGFLHSMNVSKILILNQYLEECLRPKQTSRFYIAEKIMYLLKEYI